MDDWDKGRWCDVCHQKHYQISPPCVARRKQREYAESEEGQRALRRLAERLSPDLFTERGDPAESAREDERLMAELAPLRAAAMRESGVE